MATALGRGGRLGARTALGVKTRRGQRRPGTVGGRGAGGGSAGRRARWWERPSLTLEAEAALSPCWRAARRA
eukprot:6390379-Prorocentrum_lima.AAC.1